LKIGLENNREEKIMATYDDILKRVLKEDNGILNQQEMKDFYTNLPSQEKSYQKKSFTLKFRVADKIEKVETVIDGKKETENTAKTGDYILTGTKGENFVLTPEKFNSRYIIAGGLAKTKPVKIFAKEYSNQEPVSFTASWGEKMILEIGDFLVRNDAEYYRIEKQAFANTYEGA
jgi:hypothetical protein